jgi:hypothetical protein
MMPIQLHADRMNSTSPNARESRNVMTRSLGCRLLLLLAPLTPSAWGQGSLAIPDTPPAMFLAVGDLNGDRRADIALVEAPPAKPQSAAPPTYRLHLLFQKNGKFTMPADKTITLGETRPSGLSIGDFDGDKRDDLAVGLRVQRSLSLFFASEGFEKEHKSSYLNDSGAGGLSTGSLSKRKQADFLTGAAWRQWQGKDRFGEAYFAGADRNDNWRSTLADMDRDGTDDVIFTTFGSDTQYGLNNRLRIYYGPFAKMGVLQPSDAAEVLVLHSPVMDSDKPLLGQVMTGDLNGDDQRDLVVPAPAQTLVYLQNSPSGFSERADPTLVLKDVTPLLVTDLDGDKLCDIAFLPTDASKIAIWFQKKNQPLTAKSASEAPHLKIPKLSGVVASGDVNGDGRQEIFAAQTGGGLSIFALPR